MQHDRGQVPFPQTGLKRHPAFQSSQRGTDAEVCTATKCQMATRLPMNVELVRLVEVALISVGGGKHQQQGAACWHDLAVEGHIVGGDIASYMRARRLVSEQLLDGRGDQRGILGQFFSLVRMFGQDLAHPSEKAAGRLHACAGNDGQEDDEFLLGQLPRVSVFIVEHHVE